MHPTLATKLSQIRNTYRSTVQKPATVLASVTAAAKQQPRLTAGVAAGTAAVVAGVSLGAAFGPSDSVAAASQLDLSRHAVAAQAPGQPGSPISSGLAGLARAGHASSADLPRHPAASVRVAATPQSHPRPAGQHPAAARQAQPQHPAQRQRRPASTPAATTRQATQHAAGQHATARLAVTRQATARHPAVRHQPAEHHPAGHPAAVRPAAPVRPAKPFMIYDSVTPGSIPAHHMIATYATGNFAVSPAEVAGRGPIMWIDTTGSDYAASVLDVEPGDATPSLAASWAYHRLSAHRTGLARIYTMISEWPAVQSAVHTLPSWMQSRIRWWIADPTGSPHVVPGSSATQWFWGSNYDITTATPRF